MGWPAHLPAAAKQRSGEPGSVEIRGGLHWIFSTSGCNKGLFSANGIAIGRHTHARPGHFTELGHTSAQLALLVGQVRSSLVRRVAKSYRRFSHLVPVSESRLMPTIALVDDDRNILTSVSIALEAEGYRIMTYTDGASALDGFRTSPAGSGDPRPSRCRAMRGILMSRIARSGREVRKPSSAEAPSV